MADGASGMVEIGVCCMGGWAFCVRWSSRGCCGIGYLLYVRVIGRGSLLIRILGLVFAGLHGRGEPEHHEEE